MKLPNRRLNIAETIEVGDHKYHVAVGFDATGKAVEVFINGLKVGSDQEAILQDGCVAFSLILQNGINIDGLAKSLGREHIDPAAPFQDGGRAASLLGVVANLAAQIQREEGLGVKHLHELLTFLGWTQEEKVA